MKWGQEIDIYSKSDRKWKDIAAMGHRFLLLRKTFNLQFQLPLLLGLHGLPRPCTNPGLRLAPHRRRQERNRSRPADLRRAQLG